MTTIATAPHVPGSATSKAAADAIRPYSATIRQRVLEYIVERGVDGATDGEIAADLRLEGSTARPRRIELAELGLIEQSDEIRRTASGRAAVVWMATEKGRAHV